MIPRDYGRRYNSMCVMLIDVVITIMMPSTTTVPLLYFFMDEREARVVLHTVSTVQFRVVMIFFHLLLFEFA